ncbi:MAG: four helix bundle protein [Longimicrobiales bacterium]
MPEFHLERFRPDQLALEFAAIAERLARRIEKRRPSLADQVRRAAESITLNVAEGAGAFAAGDRRRYYRIALRSVSEAVGALGHAVAISALHPTNTPEARATLLQLTRLLTALCK